MVIDFNIVSGDDETLELVKFFKKNTVSHIVGVNTEQYFRGNTPILDVVFEQICDSKLTYVYKILNNVEEFRDWFVGNVDLSRMTSDKLKTKIIKEFLMIGYHDNAPEMSPEQLMLVGSKLFRKETAKLLSDDIGTVDAFIKAVYYGGI